MRHPISRRDFLQASAAVPAVAWFRVPPKKRAAAPVAVSSGNGIRAVEIAVEKMKEGWAPVDSAVKGVEVVENDPNDTSVGYGGMPNEDGVVELDSCVMDGPSGLGGAVGALRNIKNPAQVALKVMRYTDHCLLVGEGALRFARAMGFKEEDLLTDATRERWLRWKMNLSTRDDWVNPEENGELGVEWFKRETGTIHLGAVNESGDIGGCTTTSGLSGKIPGRVGDSPLMGCGNYVDNDYGVAGSTGRGEAVILSNGASFTVHQMALGRSPTDACLDACERIARMTKVPRLLDEQGRPNFGCNFYAINKAGVVGGARFTPGGRYARMTDNGPEFVDFASLYE